MKTYTVELEEDEMEELLDLVAKGVLEAFFGGLPEKLLDLRGDIQDKLLNAKG